MKIVIDKKGHLWLERGGIIEEQYCPFHGSGRPCGDWCPLFDRPLTKSEIDDINGDASKLAMLGLCHGTVLFCDGQNFTYNRGQE